MSVAVPARRTPSVLLVNYLEDERYIYSEALRRAGFTVTTCCDESDALQTALRARPDVFIARMHPRTTAASLQLIATLKAHETTNDARVVVMSATVDTPQDRAMIDAVCDAFVLLPCFPDDLVSVVASTMRAEPNAGC